MKKGKTLQELVTELDRQRQASKDFIVPTQELGFAHSPDNGYNLHFEDKQFELNNWSHSQVSTYSQVPKAYYDRIRAENPSLLTDCVNHGFNSAVQRALLKNKNEARMVRVVDDNVRGLVSSRYRRLDCYDLVEQVYPVMHENDLELESSELTEKRMFIKAFTKRFDVEIAKGITVGYGLNVSCSDVGSGAVLIQPMSREYVCGNGMIWDIAMRKFHIGRNQAGDSIEELLTDETKALDDKAFWAKVVDILQASMQPEMFDKQTNKLREAHGQEIKNFDLPKVVELSMKEVGVTGEENKNSIIQYLANGADGRGLNKWALGNAFTWAAQNDKIDYEAGTELERAGGKIIELPRQRWEHIAH